MRHPRGDWLVGIAAVALAAGCQQTVHLYAAAPDAASTGGAGGSAGKGGGGTAGKADGGVTDGHCSGGAPVFVGDTPQMVIALDRSTSMNQSFPSSSTTHLSAAIHALYSNVGLYSPSSSMHEPRLPITFWFLDFPDSATACSSAPDCCVKDAVHTTSTTFQTATFCETPPNACVSSSNRPASAALAAAEQALGSASTPGSPRFVLLLTDGDPQGDCSADDCSAAIKQANTLNGDSIRVLIVGIGIPDQSSSNCLFDIANAANGNTTSPYLSLAQTANDVSLAVGNAMSTALCNGTVMNRPAVLNGIKIGGTSYLPSQTDQWTYDATSGRLHLHNAACQNYVQFGGVQVNADCWPGYGGPGYGP